MKMLDISIIIPVFNEQQGINRLLDSLSEFNDALEIIVVDGDPDGNTLACIQNPQVIGIKAACGRAMQMNAGANIARGEVLLFLHSDTLLPATAITSIQQALADQQYVGGCFNICLDAPNIIIKTYSQFINIRTQCSRIPVGDQAIFLRKTTFEKLGGFPAIAIMEEIDFMRTLKKQGYKITILADPVLTSARRFKQDGVCKRIFMNWLIVMLYYLGFPPTQLAKLYRYRQAK